MGNALQTVRVRSASAYVPSGQAPDMGVGMAFNVAGGASANAGLSVDAAATASAVLVLLLIAVVVATHAVAR